MARDQNHANEFHEENNDDDAENDAFAALGNRAKEFQASEERKPASTGEDAPAAAVMKDTHRDRVNQFLQRPFSPPLPATAASQSTASSSSSSSSSSKSRIEQLKNRVDQFLQRPFSPPPAGSSSSLSSKRAAATTTNYRDDNGEENNDNDKDAEYADFQNTPPPSKQNSRDWSEQGDEEKDGPSPFLVSNDRLEKYLPRLTMSNAHHRRITLAIIALAVLCFVALTAWIQTVVSRDEMKSDLFAPGSAAAESAAAAQHGFPALGTTETSGSQVGVGGDTGGSSSNSSSTSTTTAEEGDSDAVATSTTPNEEKIMDERVKVGNGKACFETLTDLKGAVDLYLFARTDPSKQASFDAVYGDQYGTNIQDWCLGPKIIDLSHLFDANRNHNAAQFNQDISQWNVSNVQKMAGMFSGAAAFNQPIGAWDTRNVQFMGQMFLGAKSFNQDLSGWNTAKVQYMTAMFKGAAAFSQPLDKWDVASVKTMSSMFQGALKFNRPLNAWNVSNVGDMSNMFSGARVFNQPLNAWDVSRVHKMKEMFMYAFAFNQPLDQWQPKAAEDMQNMFKKAGAFDQNLCSWAPYLTGREINLQFMFRETSCNSIKDPNLKIAKPGPFCDWCGAGE